MRRFDYSILTQQHSWWIHLSAVRCKKTAVRPDASICLCCFVALLFHKLMEYQIKQAGSRMISLGE